MIRHYDLIGLVRPGRHANNYRVYTEHCVARLRFIRHARELAMSLTQVQSLLSLWDGGATPEEIRQRVAAEVERLEGKAEALKALAAALRDLAETTYEERPSVPRFEREQLPPLASPDGG